MLLDLVEYGPFIALEEPILLSLYASIYHYYLATRISGRSPLAHSDAVAQHLAFRRALQVGLARLPKDGLDEEPSPTWQPGTEIEQLEPGDLRAIDFRKRFCTWFGKAPFSSLRDHHVSTWLYSSMFNERMPPLEDIPPNRRSILDAALRLIEKRAGLLIPVGTDHSIKPICLIVDKVNVNHRPFMWYATLCVANLLVRKWLEQQWDMVYGSHEGLEYMIRIPGSWNRATGPRPVVFIHGLGLGLLQYIVFITLLLEGLQDRPLLVLIQPHISQDIFHPRYLRPMPSWEATNALAGLLGKLGWAEEAWDSNLSEHEEREVTRHLVPEDTPKGVTMLSHSNGSYAHAWMLKRHPSVATRSCFIDPVAFCSWEGDVCYNFIYRPCATGVEVLLRYFVGTELGVANLLQRHYDWVANTLWYEEIPNARDPSKTVFVIGGKDEIVQPERVMGYLRSHGIRKGLWYNPEASHGALLAGGPRISEIILWLKR